MSDARAIRALARDLRVSVPTLLPVRVKVCDQLDAWGYASLRKTRGRATGFVIELRRCHLQIMRDTLMHEWAHCLAWREGDLTEDHGPEWGLAMSAVHTAIGGA